MAINKRADGVLDGQDLPKEGLVFSETTATQIFLHSWDPSSLLHFHARVAAGDKWACWQPAACSCCFSGARFALRGHWHQCGRYI